VGIPFVFVHIKGVKKVENKNIYFVKCYFNGLFFRAMTGRLEVTAAYNRKWPIQI
jgi:hypothetical protein